MLLHLLKGLCALLYLAAIAGLFGWLPPTQAHLLQILSLAFLAIHALELVFVMPLVRRWPGPLGLSVLQALLFGVLHWKPLAKLR